MDQQQLMELLGGAGGFPHALAGMGSRGRAVLETQRFVVLWNTSYHYQDLDKLIHELFV